MSAPLIELRVPADPASAPVVRTCVASIAARLDFTLDQLEDVRLATTEACALLLGLPAQTDALLAAVVATPHHDTLRIDLSRAGSLQALPGPDSFAWTVLHALVDDVSVFERDGEVHLMLTSTREVDPGGGPDGRTMDRA